MQYRRGLVVALLLGGMISIGQAIVAGCSPRRTEPISGPTLLDDATLVAGQKTFNAVCHQCHPHGEAGLGPALNNKPLPAFLIKRQVRMGAGAMPSFSDQQVSDEELDNLVDYAIRLRHK